MKILGSATGFRVADLNLSLQFYKNCLGFREEFRFGDYAGISKGKVTLHLAGPSVPNARQVGEGAIYIFCEGVDEFYGEIVAKGGRVLAPPKNYHYGLRDFIAVDLDGNILTFGERPQLVEDAVAPQPATVNASEAVNSWQRYLERTPGTVHLKYKTNVDVSNNGRW